MNRSNVLITALCLSVVCLSGCSKKEPETGATSESSSSAESVQAAGEKGEEMGTGDAIALAAEFRKKCSDTASESRECAILHSLAVVEATFALEQIERARDQRGSEEALAALDITDEPEILIAACRVLGQFPDTPGIAEKAIPLVLSSPYIQVQEAAANLLARNSEQGVADIGRLWESGHSTLGARNEFEEYPDFPAHYAAMKFPAYPGAEWFSPGDSQQSIGWSTADDAATVAGWIGKQLNSESLTSQQWFERSAAVTANAFQSMDQSKMERIQKLSEQYGKTLDPALIAEIDKLQKEMSAPMEAASKIADQSMSNVAMPGNSSPPEDVHYFIAEEKAGHIARAMLVYRLPGIDRTVVQTSWNLGDYPSAWPEEGTPL